MGISEFQRNKLRLRFETLDVNGSGYLELGDYLRITSRLTRSFPIAAGDDRVVALVAAYRRLWRQLLSLGDTDGDRRVDRAEFVLLMAALIDTPGGFDTMLRPTIEAVFDVSDLDEDGHVDGEELRLMLNGYGVPDAMVDAAVDRIAPDGTSLDRSQFTELLREFYCGDDPADPAGRLFGELAT